MATLLEEVPGARERPGGCPIQIRREEDRTVSVVIPARGVSPPVLFFSAVLLGNLLLTLYTGAYLLLAQRSVLFMAQISPGGLPVPLRPYGSWLWLALLLASGLGFGLLAVILRPITVRETLTIGPEWLTVQAWQWGRRTERHLARSEVRGFRLTRVPPGLDSGTLSVQGRGEEIVLGEYLREADREWLASAGNALLTASGD